MYKQITGKFPHVFDQHPPVHSRAILTGHYGHDLCRSFYIPLGSPALSSLAGGGRGRGRGVLGPHEGLFGLDIHVNGVDEVDA